MAGQTPLLALAKRISRAQRFNANHEAELTRQLLESVYSASQSQGDGHAPQPGCEEPLAVVTDSRLVVTLASRMRTSPWGEIPDVISGERPNTSNPRARSVCSALSTLNPLFMYVHERVIACSYGRTAQGPERQALKELIKQVGPHTARNSQGSLSSALCTSSTVSYPGRAVRIVTPSSTALS
jgi:hypothetical protein